MAIEIICSCGRVLNAPDSAIGKKGRCKGCGKVVNITALPEPVEEDGVPDLGIQMEDEDVPIDPRLAPPLPAVPSAKIPPEPFYYGFLVFYAYTCILIGIIQFLCFLALGAGGFLSTAKDDTPSAVALGSMVLMSLGWMLGGILISCPILLAVDAARNVRAMRFDLK